MGDLEGAPAVRINIPLLSFYLSTTFKTGIAAAGEPIGAKPNLYCKSIELVCGGSPKLCVLVEWKALDRVKSELEQPKPVWISCLILTVTLLSVFGLSDCDCQISY